MKKQGAALRRPASPEVVRDAITMVDLAISRCRAGRYADDHFRDQVLAALRAARQELRRISEGPAPAAEVPEAPVEVAPVASAEKRLVKNGHDRNSN